MVLNVSTQWKVKTNHKFNTVSFGKLFKQTKESIVAVGEDGIVQVYEIPNSNFEKGKLSTIAPVKTFETKCGPASHILLKDVTRLAPCDMLVADTRGAVVLFCDGQILVRRCSLSGKTSRVTALEVQETGLGSIHVIVGKDDGELTCFNTFSTLWKLRLSDIKREKMLKAISVTCILAAAVLTSSGGVGDYVLVADSDGYLHIIENGELLSSIHVKSVVSTMAQGNFLQTEDSQRHSNSATQIALGCMDGCIWIMVDFAVDTSAQYANIGHPVTHLRKVPSKQNHVSPVNSGENGIVDLLVCGGHFHSLKIFQHGKLMFSLPLSSWPVSICGIRDWMDTESRDQDQTESFVLVGCQDATLECVKIT